MSKRVYSKSNEFLKYIDNSWTLFLDRDGTINRRIIGGYVTQWKNFEFLRGVEESIPVFNKSFFKTIIVTNQQGVGKEWMTQHDLDIIHDKMCIQLMESGGRIDEIFACTDLAIYDSPNRKPNPGMALQAKEVHKDINFKKSIMIGDTASDIEFGKNLGMRTILIDHGTKSNENLLPDLKVTSLFEFAQMLVDYEVVDSFQ